MEAVIDLFISRSTDLPTYDTNWLHTSFEKNTALWRLAQGVGICGSWMICGAASGLVLHATDGNGDTVLLQSVTVLSWLAAVCLFKLCSDVIKMPARLVGTDKCPRAYLKRYGTAFISSAITAIAMVWINISTSRVDRAWPLVIAASGAAGFSAMLALVDEVHFTGAWPVEEKTG